MNDLVDGAKLKPKVMNHYGLSYFISYEYFLYLDLITCMAQRMDLERFQIHAYRKWLVIDSKEYQPLCFIDYSMEAIIHAFIVLTYWVTRMKKSLNIKHEAKECKNNGAIMLNWLNLHYKINTSRL